MRIFDTFMMKDELDVLQMRLEALEGEPMVEHVLVEAAHTHTGVPKPLYYAENRAMFARWADRIHQVTPPVRPVGMKPWAFEHAQRNAAWLYINQFGKAGDLVLICDIDEIPFRPMLDWRGDQAASVEMRTFLFAVDWEVSRVLPPTCVVATVGYLRLQAGFGYGLGEIRDMRDFFPRIYNGGMHFSWIGGPERQSKKLHEATCHTELLGTPEGALIDSGARWATSQDGGGLPVKPVDVDESWPAYIYERRCPHDWFRPRGVELEAWQRRASGVQ